MKKINWIDHIANLLVVILGISIAFYLESYKEEANLRKQEYEYLESMIQDMAADLEALDTLVSLNNMISNSLKALSDGSIGQPYGGDSTLRNHVLLIQYNPPFSPQRTTYESLKASGKIDLISDFELRNDIIDLYEQFYRGSSQYDDVLTEHVRDFIKPFFIEHMRYTSRTEISNEFLVKNDFKNMIFAYRYLFSAKNEFYKEMNERVSEIKERLEVQLVSLS